LAIGSLLILALVEVFAASRAAYMLATGLARTPENGRFAIDTLPRDLRMAGHAGCVNDQARSLTDNVTASRPALTSPLRTDDHAAVWSPGLRFDMSITGYEAVNTASGDTVSIPATPVVAGQGAWTGMPGNLFAAFPSAANAPGRPVTNSDVLVLRFFAPTGV